MSTLANRHFGADWLLPLEASEDYGIVTPSCRDRLPWLVPYEVGVGLRIGGEVILCFQCGPNGGVYHPDPDYTMADVHAVAERLAAA